MNINWFQDPDHLVYINAEKRLGELENRLKLPGLCEAANALHADPNDVGYTLKGPKRTCGRLFRLHSTTPNPLKYKENR